MKRETWSHREGSPPVHYAFADKQITRPRVEHGGDWERPRIVLIRDERPGETFGRELWWMKPGKTSAGRGMGRRGLPAELATWEPEPGTLAGGRHTTLQEGGRLGIEAVRANRRAITDFFGDVEVWSAFDRDETLIILPWKEPPG